MYSHLGKGRLRKSISSLLSVAIVFSMLILPATPAVAATASTGGTVTSGGTGLTSTVGTGTTSGNGINGTHSIHVTGTVASQTKVRGKSGLTTGYSLANLDATNAILAVETSSSPHTGYDGVTGGRSYNLISGVSITTGTVQSVINAINSQVTSVTAYIEDTYIFVKANKVGDYTVSILTTVGSDGVTSTASNTTVEGTASLGAKLFGLYGGTGTDPSRPTTVSAVTGLLPYGTKMVLGDSYGYSAYGSTYGAFTATDTFVVSTLTSYQPNAQANLGHMNTNFSPAKFESTVDTTTGYYSAVQLGEGYDLVLYTGSNSTGIAHGTALVTVSGGTRDNVVPKSMDVSTGPVGASFITTLAAGVTTQVVITLESTTPVGAATDETHTIEAASFTAPAGFFVPTTVTVQAQVNHNDGSGREVASASVSGQIVSVRNFSMQATESLTVTLPAVTAATAAGVHAWTGTYTLMSGTSQTMFSDPNVSTDGNRDLTVWPLYTVSSLAFTQPTGYYARANTTITVFANALDVYGNPVGVRWPNHKVRFDVPADSTIATQDLQIDGASRKLQYGFKVPSTAGTSSIRAWVSEITTSVNVISTGIGAPSKLVLASASNPNTNAATSGSYSPIVTTFTVSFLDSNDKPTGFVSSDSPQTRNIKVHYGSGGASSTIVSKSQTETISAGSAYMSSSEVTFTLNGYAGESWNMWASDWQVGALTQSPNLAQTFGTAVTAVASTAMTVSVGPRALDGSRTAGYAAAGGTDYVSVVVTGVPVGHRVSMAATNVCSLSNDTTLPGSVDITSGVVGASGAVTFTVRSTYPVMRGTARAWKNWQIADETSGTTAVPPVLVQTHFYAPTIQTLVVDKTHVLADGNDRAVYTATVVDPIASAPTSGATVWFSKSTTSTAGTLSSTSATTNASGIATISISSSSAGTATVSARDAWGTNEIGAPHVIFDSIQAQPATSVETTAQQSVRGPRASFGMKLVNSNGTTATFSVVQITGIVGTDTANMGGSLNSEMTTSVANNVISIICTLPGGTAAGTTVQLVVSGSTVTTDALGTATRQTFQGVMPVTVVNNATAVGTGSNLAAGGTLTGSGFRPSIGSAVTSVGVSIKIGADWVTVGSIQIGTDGALQQPVLDCRGAFAGTYDLRIDGITFTQAFTVSNTLSTVPVNLTLYRDPASSADVTAGASVVLRGAITDGNTGGRLAKHVELQSAPVGTTTWTTIDQVDTDTNGLYGPFTVNPTVSTYYRTHFAGDVGYAEGNSPTVTVGVIGYVPPVPAAPLSIAVAPVTLAGSSTAGYAAADGLHPVTIVVSGVVGHTVSLVATNASSGITDTLLPGTASATSAVVPAGGSVTFTISSTSTCMNGTARAWKNWQIADETSGTTTVPPLLAQTHFFAPTISSLVPDRAHVFANGTDVAVYSATVVDPIASAPVVGTPVTFSKTSTAAAGTLSTASATTNASGIAQVSITSTSGGTAIVTASDFTGTSVATATAVTFDDISALPSTSATITAQQSARGPRPSFDIRLVDTAGAAVSFSAASIDSITGIATGSPFTTSVASNTISITCTLPGTTAAGTTVQLAVSGSATVSDTVGGSSTKAFQGTIPVTIVNNATATGSSSNLAAGGTLTGSGFRAPSTIATGADSVSVEALVATSWVTIGTVVIGSDGSLQSAVLDCRSMASGAYDLRIDGITFTQALTVTAAQALPSTSATITAQQSARGPRPSFGIRLVDGSGSAVSFSSASIDSISGIDAGSVITTSVANNVISVVCLLPGATAAGTTVQMAVTGRAWGTDAQGVSSLKTFQGTIPVTVVNNATAIGSGSNLAAGGDLTGSGFRAPSGTAIETVNVEVRSGTSWLTIGTVAITSEGSLQQDVLDCHGLVAMTYDMRIDGITFAQAFTVTNVLSTTPVNLTLRRDPVSTAYVTPGAAVVLRGAITDGVTGNRLARSVALQSAAVGSSTWTTVDEVDTGADGLYGFSVRPRVSTQYRVSFAGDAGYASGNSSALTINVKSAISLSTPSTTLVQRRGVAYTARGTVSASAPSVRIYVYRYYSGAYRLARTYNATKAGTSYSARIVLTVAGRYRMRAYAPAGTTTLAKYSSYRYVTVR